MKYKGVLIISLVALGVATFALFRVEVEVGLSREIVELLRDVDTELQFAHIVDRLEDDN